MPKKNPSCRWKCKGNYDVEAAKTRGEPGGGQGEGGGREEGEGEVGGGNKVRRRQQEVTGGD